MQGPEDTLKPPLTSPVILIQIIRGKVTNVSTSDKSMDLTEVHILMPLCN